MENQTEQSYTYYATLLNTILLFSNIPFIIITIFVIAYYSYRIVALFRARNIPDESLSKKEFRKTNILVYKFILLILLIELSSNILRAVSGWVNAQFPTYQLQSIPLTNSCRVNVRMDFQMEMYPNGLFAYFPSIFEIFIIQLLQPIVSLLLYILRRKYLSLPYKNVCKRWLITILIRSCIIFLLFLFYQTFYFATFLITLSFLIDFIIYLINSKRFHSLLKNRKEVARLHSSPEEYRDKSRVLSQYKVTSLYTTVVFFILTLTYIFWGIKLNIHGFVRILCTINLITLGYSPLIFYDSTTLHIAHKVSFSFFFIIESLDYLYQILISFAYCTICFGISIRLCRRVKRFREINTSIRPLVTNYHSTLYLQ